MKKPTAIRFLALSTLASCFSLEAVTYIGSDGGDWAAPANWGGLTPTLADDAVINGPGPVVSTPGQTAKIVYLRGGTATLTMAGGDLTADQGVRLGHNTAGAANLVVNGGTLTSNGIIYVAQTANSVGSKLTLNSGRVDVNSDFRIGTHATNAAGQVVVNGGTLTTDKEFYIAQTAGSAGSKLTFNGGAMEIGTSLRVGFADTGFLDISGGTLQAGTVTPAQGRLDFGSGKISILDDDATINFPSSFIFGILGPSTLEYVLTPAGTTSPLSIGALDLTKPVSRTLSIDGSNVMDPQSINSLVLFHSNGSPFTQNQVDLLNGSLSLVNLSGLSLALANQGADIALVPEPSVLVVCLGLLPVALLIIRRRK